MNKEPMRVLIETFDSRKFIGYLYLEQQERLQDLLNDWRKFIPVHVVSECTDSNCSIKDVNFKVIIMQKNCIASIESAPIK